MAHGAALVGKFRFLRRNPPWQKVPRLGATSPEYPLDLAKLCGARVMPLRPSMLEPKGDSTDPETYAIIGAAMEVHRILGCGFVEAPYARALLIELQLRGIPVEREQSFPLRYKGHVLHLNYRADMVCYGSVVVEVKAVRALGDVDMAQAVNYLKASGLTKALLLNFSGRSLVYKRVVLSSTGPGVPVGPGLSNLPKPFKSA